MLAQAVTFVAGVLLLHTQSTLPSIHWSFLLAALLPVVGWLPSAARPASAFAIGFLWALLHAHWVLSHALPPMLQGEDLVVEGVIASLPEIDEEKARFVFHIDRLTAHGADHFFRGNIRLSWYRKPPVLVAGERWLLHVRLKQPHGFMNPGGFDYEGWLYQQGIRATGYVRDGPDNRKLAAGDRTFFLQRLRQHIRHLLEERTDTAANAGLLKALVIGDRSGLSSRDWRLFQSTGTSHLIAISGLHIGIVAGLALLVGNLLWRSSPQLCLVFAAPRAAAVVAMAAAIAYAALAGFSLPTQRALVMLALGLGAVLMQRSIQPFRSLSVAVLILVAIDPRAPLSPGFWLSFVAVSVILLAVSGRTAKPGRILSWLTIQWFIALGLAPLLLAWQGQVPLLAPLINLVAIPFFSLLIIPAALLGTLLSLAWPLLGSPLLDLAGWLLESSRTLLCALPVADFQLNLPGVRPWYIWLFAAGGVLLLLAPGGFPGRWLGTVLLLPLGLHAQDRPGHGDVWLDLLDVGQGMALVIRTNGHLLVYDTGPRFSSNFDAGSAVVVPFLQAQGVEKIDKLILSNGDMDHQGGFNSLTERFPVGAIISGEPGRIEGGQALPCAADVAWRWDDVNFRVLHPQPGATWRGNNASCVLVVENGAVRILVTGDIEGAAEKHLLTLNPGTLKSDLLTIPHHGSKTSSLPAFVHATSPAFALVSSGYNNRYDFPKPSVVSRWERQGARVIDTATAGAVHFRLGRDGQISAPQRYRIQARRYWNHSPGFDNGH